MAAAKPAKAKARKPRARKPAASTPPASTSPSSSSSLPAAAPQPLTQPDAPAPRPTDDLGAEPRERPANLDAILGDRAEELKALEQGYAGTKVDPLPNEAYSLESGPDSPLASDALGNVGQENS